MEQGNTSLSGNSCYYLEKEKEDLRLYSVISFGNESLWERDPADFHKATWQPLKLTSEEPKEQNWVICRDVDGPTDSHTE